MDKSRDCKLKVETVVYSDRTFKTEKNAKFILLKTTLNGNDDDDVNILAKIRISKKALTTCRNDNTN